MRSILTDAIKTRCVLMSLRSKVRTVALLYKCRVERDMGINRGNKKLLEKLVEISKGKHVRNSWI